MLLYNTGNHNLRRKYIEVSKYIEKMKNYESRNNRYQSMIHKTSKQFNYKLPPEYDDYHPKNGKLKLFQFKLINEKNLIIINSQLRQ